MHGVFKVDYLIGTAPVFMEINSMFNWSISNVECVNGGI